MKTSRSASIVYHSRRESLSKLNLYYDIVCATIARNQDPVTGLLSLSGSEEAWVRDNTYAGMAFWGLSLAYKKLYDLQECRAKCFELEQAVVKLMRSLLHCMMNQRAKVEAFKYSMSPSDALHAKYSSRTTDPTVGDYDYGHLQLDATALYLLTLAQMTSAGLHIIFTLDEVSFVQNLVFYIQNAYMIPDFGIWERGDKTNHGVPELNSSSVGMSKAALEAMNELDLFGVKGGPLSIIHVSPDVINWCNDVLNAMLPRESSSKETDAALLSIVSFPAFAVDDRDLIETTTKVIISKLQGRYGLCRFLRDGYKCPKEDCHRLYYEPSELKLFENLECEWPLFWAYLVIDGVFNNDSDKVHYYTNALEGILLQDKDGIPLFPQMYAVPADKVDLEIANPKSQNRIPLGQVSFAWGQALYVLSLLLSEGLVAPGELDPLNRRLLSQPKPATIIQLSIITESDEIKTKMADAGITVYTAKDVGPISVFHIDLLQEMLCLLGRNDNLHLSGNPISEVGGLSTSKFYSIKNMTLAFIPEIFKEQSFYIYSDMAYLLDSFRSYLAIIEKSWNNIAGRPTVIFYLKSSFLDAAGNIHPALLSTCKKITSGYLGSVRIHYGKLQDFLSTSCVTTLDFLASDDEDCDALLSIDNYMRSSSCSHPSLLEHIAAHPKFKRTKKLTDIRGSIRRSRSIFQYDQNGPFPASPTKPELSESSFQSTDSFESVKEEDRQHRRLGEDYKSKNIDEVIALLSEYTNLSDQADILHYLYERKGLGFHFTFDGKTCVLADFVNELYEKSLDQKVWSLVRHCAGVLGMKSNGLSKALTSILVHNKQVSVGFPKKPPFQEIIFTRPVTLEVLYSEIKKACADNASVIVLTQELLIALSSFISTDAHLFQGMIRIRIGLLISVLGEELQKMYDCSAEEASDNLFNLSPFELKNLLKLLLSGQEFLPHTQPSLQSQKMRNAIDNSLFKMGPAPWLGSKRESIAALNFSSSASTAAEEDKQGQWLRRRRIDGSLNRVPVGFYEQLWQALEKCHGIKIADIFLSQSLTQEMTREELKFALEIENAINTVPIPHYRQLIVEAVMMFCLIILSNKSFHYYGVVDMDEVVNRANELFINDQLKAGIDKAQLKATNNEEYLHGNAILEAFYDSAPSGRFGTMSYMLRALFGVFRISADSEWSLS